MSRHDSHAFVFGGNALTNPSQAPLNHTETILSDPFAQEDDTASSSGRDMNDHLHASEVSKYDLGSPQKGALAAVRKKNGMDVSRCGSKSG